MDNSVNNSEVQKNLPEQEVKAEAVSVPVTQPETKEKHRTIGNIIYDFPVFGGIAWGGVAALSALSAHESMFGKSKYFAWLRTLNKVVYNGVKGGLSKTIMKDSAPEIIDGYAKGTTMFATLGMGGNALMAPIKWMEDNRQKNAARIDNLLGTTPPDPETIKNEPKQTWGSVFKGRLISWGGSYVAFLSMGPKLTGKLNDFIGEIATNKWMKWKPQSDIAKVSRWSNIAAFDALFTVITASATYIFSRYFARCAPNKPSIADEVFALNMADPKAFTSEVPSKEEDASASHKETNFAEKCRSKRCLPSAGKTTFVEKSAPQAEFSPTM